MEEEEIQTETQTETDKTKEKLQMFMGELKKLCDVHGCDIQATIKAAPTGIVPVLNIFERKYTPDITEK